MLTNGPEQEANDQQLELDGEATLEQRLEEATRERDQFRAMAQRAQADFINYKRRIEEERQLIGQEAASQVIMQLLPVLDDFQLALEHLHAEASASWSEGVQMIFRKLQTLLETEGVTAIRPEPGTAFDPAEQEVVYGEPSSEYPEGMVTSILRPGYRNGSRVLRPAQVVLAQAERA